MAIKYINIFPPKGLQNLPKSEFLVRKETIWQPWVGAHWDRFIPFFSIVFVIVVLAARLIRFHPVKRSLSIISIKALSVYFLNKKTLLQNYARSRCGQLKNWSSCVIDARKNVLLSGVTHWIIFLKPLDTNSLENSDLSTPAFALFPANWRFAFGLMCLDSEPRKWETQCHRSLYIDGQYGRWGRGQGDQMSLWKFAQIVARFFVKIDT
jgi:hypothetical protein